MDIDIINNLFDSSVIFKTGLLVLILFHGIFLFIVFIQINSMGRIVQIHASGLLKFMAIVAMLLSFSLFFIALVIL